MIQKKKNLVIEEENCSTAYPLDVREVGQVLEREEPFDPLGC
jgi:hypothetical protein